MSFVHLHVHSQYSFLDGASSMERLLARAAEMGMPAMAITDHNRLTGAIRFYEKARNGGIKPIIGVEVTIEGGYHITLLCKNLTGYSNLCQLITQAQLCNRGGKPFASKEALRKYSEGLICLSGCSRGEIPSFLKEGREEQADLATQFYREIFADDFFIELVRYPSKYEAESYRLADFAAGKGLPVVATNNVHYVNMEEYQTKELLNAIDQNKPVSTKRGWRTVEQYLKSQDEMAWLFRDIPRAIAATGDIASRCNLQLDLGKPRFPKFDVPGNESDYSFLSKLSLAGISKRYGQSTGKIRQRLEHELETIEGLGFCGYFLVVWDIVRWAKERGIRCQARGSAVDSLVVYSLGISDVDPIAYDLLFERFMHPLRKEPPDIDLDIDRRHRSEVRDYIYNKYGAENVACVGTINTYMARELSATLAKPCRCRRRSLRKPVKESAGCQFQGLWKRPKLSPS